METPDKRSRADAIDCDRFRTMIASEPFKLLQAKIQQELTRAREITENATEALIIHRAQGAIRFARMVLALPKQLLDTMEKENTNK